MPEIKNSNNIIKGVVYTALYEVFDQTLLLSTRSNTDPKYYSVLYFLSPFFFLC